MFHQCVFATAKSNVNYGKPEEDMIVYLNGKKCIAFPVRDQLQFRNRQTFTTFSSENTLLVKVLQTTDVMISR
jgi:hypothetical protein